MADPTPEEIAEFKRVFKAKAKEANKKIRWDEPQGCLPFFKSQTSLAPIVEALEDLQDDPSTENIQAVLTKIDGLSDDSAKKYDEAIASLTHSLTQALEESQEPETIEIPVVPDDPPVIPTPVEVEVSSQDESEPESVVQPKEPIDPEDEELLDRLFKDYIIENAIMEADEADRIWDEWLDRHRDGDSPLDDPGINSELLEDSEDEGSVIDDPQEREEEDRRLFREEEGLEDATKDEFEEAWDKHLDELNEEAIDELHDQFKSAPEIPPHVPAGVSERMRVYAGECNIESDVAYWTDKEFWAAWQRHIHYDIEFDGDTDEADEALADATFDPEAEPEKSVMDQLLESMPGWKHDRNIVLADKSMTMSFQKSIKETAVGGVEYWSGQVPGVGDDESMHNVKVVDMPEQDQAMISVAKDAIGKIRSKLTKGPFNNYGGLPDEILAKQRIPEEILEHHGRQDLDTTPAPAWWNAVVEVAALKAMNQVKGKYKDVNDQKIQMACLARATQEVGGGVCSKMAMCTTGELTTSLPPGSEIVQLFHDFDHEFVIARVPGGSWFAVDPWPHDPTVLPFVDCQFNPTGVKNFVITKVTETADHPFGIDLDGVNWKAMIKAAMEETKIDALEMKGSYGHKGNQDSGNYDPALKAPNNWG